MATTDKCVTIVPYFNVPEGKMEQVKEYCEKFVEKTRSEPACLYYGFSFCGSSFHCREGYTDADGLLAHLENVGQLLGELLEIVELVRLEVHGPADELAKLKGPMESMNPEFYVLEYGFRR